VVYAVEQRQNDRGQWRLRFSDPDDPELDGWGSLVSQVSGLPVFIKLQSTSGSRHDWDASRPDEPEVGELIDSQNSRSSSDSSDSERCLSAPSCAKRGGFADGAISPPYQFCPAFAFSAVGSDGGRSRRDHQSQAAQEGGVADAGNSISAADNARDDSDESDESAERMLLDLEAMLQLANTTSSSCRACMGMKSILAPTSACVVDEQGMAAARGPIFKASGPQISGIPASQYTNREYV
jgi:hypothetical protein